MALLHGTDAAVCTFSPERGCYVPRAGRRIDRQCLRMVIQKWSEVIRMVSCESSYVDSVLEMVRECSFLVVYGDLGIRKAVGWAAAG